VLILQCLDRANTGSLNTEQDSSGGGNRTRCQTQQHARSERKQSHEAQSIMQQTKAKPIIYTTL